MRDDPIEKPRYAFLSFFFSKNVEKEIIARKYLHCVTRVRFSLVRISHGLRKTAREPVFITGFGKVHECPER